MKKKWLLTACSLGFLLLLGCSGQVRRFEPFTYQFVIGQTVCYRVHVESTLSLEAGLLGYQGDVKLDAKVYLTPIEMTNGAYRFHMIIKDVSIGNADRSVSGAIYGYLNYLSSVFYEWYMTPKGEVTVYFANTPQSALQWFANMVFVDVSRWDALIDKGEEKSARFDAFFQNQSMHVESSLFQRMVRASREYYTIDQQYRFVALREKQIQLAVLDIEMESDLGRNSHRLHAKRGSFQFQGSVPFLQQGIFTLAARFQGMGQFVIEEEALQ